MPLPDEAIPDALVVELESLDLILQRILRVTGPVHSWMNRWPSEFRANWWRSLTVGWGTWRYESWTCNTETEELNERPKKTMRGLFAHRASRTWRWSSGVRRRVSRVIAILGWISGILRRVTGILRRVTCTVKFQRRKCRCCSAYVRVWETWIASSNNSNVCALTAATTFLLSFSFSHTMCVSCALLWQSTFHDCVQR